MDTVESLQKKIDAYETKIASMEIDGKAKLYYSLNRNMADLSTMLDSIKMADINLEDPKDKTMERLKMIWASVSPLVQTISLLSTGITGNEEDDTARKPFVNTIADNRK